MFFTVLDRFCIDWNTKCRFQHREGKQDDKSRKKEALHRNGKEMNLHCSEMQGTNRNFENVPEVPELRPLVERFVERIIFLNPPTRKH